MLASLDMNLAALKARYEKDLKKASKIEAKVAVLTGGYEQRRSLLLERIQSKADALRSVEIENGTTSLPSKALYLLVFTSIAMDRVLSQACRG